MVLCNGFAVSFNYRPIYYLEQYLELKLGYDLTKHVTLVVTAIVSCDIDRLSITFITKCNLFINKHVIDVDLHVYEFLITTSSHLIAFCNFQTTLFSSRLRRAWDDNTRASYYT